MVINSHDGSILEKNTAEASRPPGVLPSLPHKVGEEEQSTRPGGESLCSVSGAEPS